MKKFLGILLAAMMLTSNVFASSTVECNIPASYEVEIPAVIYVGNEMQMSGYFNIPDGSEVLVYIDEDSLNADGNVNLYDSADHVIGAGFYDAYDTKVTDSNVPIVRFTSDSSESTTFRTELCDYGENKAGRYSGTVTFSIQYNEYA